MNNDLREKYAGVYVGIVVYNKDPEHLGRLQVRVDEVHGMREDEEDEVKIDELLPWASGVTFMGGCYDGGSHTPFPVGASVLVSFEQGDPYRPWVLGGVPKKPLPDEWVYGDKDTSMQEWIPQDGDTDLPKEVRDDREETKYLLFKTPKGAASVIEERDEEEFWSLIDRAGQAIQFSSPVKGSQNQGNQEQRGTRSSLTGDQVQYSSIVDGEASIRIIDLAGQHVFLRAKKNAESIEVLNRKRGSGDIQKVILDNTVGAEEIRILDRKGQRIVMKSGGSDQYILLQSGNARIRLDGTTGRIYIDGTRVDINLPGPPGE